MTARLPSITVTIVNRGQVGERYHATVYGSMVVHIAKDLHRAVSMAMDELEADGEVKPLAVTGDAA